MSCLETVSRRGLSCLGLGSVWTLVRLVLALSDSTSMFDCVTEAVK